MEKQIKTPVARCPKCGQTEKQMRAGYNRSGTQRCVCRDCKYKYTLNGKTREYSEEVKQQAIRTYYAGVSGRGVGKIFGMSKANVYNWIKKTSESQRENKCLELDELYWFVGEKSQSPTRENVYVMTAVSRNPRKIVGFDVAADKSSWRIQRIADNAPPAEKYYTDGYTGYLDVVYYGEHVRNISNKNDTFTVEGVNADLRHYIPVLARRGRCFPRKLETLQAVIEVFVEAYNKFGEAKMRFRQNRDPNSRELPFSVPDYL